MKKKMAVMPEIKPLGTATEYWLAVRVTLNPETLEVISEDVGATTRVCTFTNRLTFLCSRDGLAMRLDYSNPVIKRRGDVSYIRDITPADLPLVEVGGSRLSRLATGLTKNQREREFYVAATRYKSSHGIANAA